MKEVSVEIFIPAYNEHANIRALLLSIPRQEQKGFELRKITVASDGSTDATVSEVQKAASFDSRIVLINYSERAGKAARLNRAFGDCEADIFVQFDADVTITDPELLRKLIRPLLDDPQGAIVCGWHKPLPPRTYVEKLACVGVEVWQKAMDSIGADAEFYYCTGNIRAFSRNFVKHLRVPTQYSAIEDLYSFYYAKHKGEKVFVAADAIVNFRLPNNLKDYFSQMRRSMRSQSDAKKLLDELEYSSHQKMTLEVKLNTLLKSADKYSFWTLLAYLILQFTCRAASLSYKLAQTWPVVRSSKV